MRAKKKKAPLVSFGNGYSGQQILKIAASREPTNVLIAYETKDGQAFYTWSNMKLRDLTFLSAALQAAVQVEMIDEGLDAGV